MQHDKLREHAEKMRKKLEPLDRFVREYASGFRPNDLQRLFERDAPTAYRVLTRDQRRPDETLTGPKLVWYHIKVVFLGLTSKLTPSRRLLFTVAVFLVLLGCATYNFIGSDGQLQIDGSPLFFLLGSACLVLLLGLELVDRINVRDELEIARELQHELLPHRAPPVDGYQFAFSYRTANEVGGDYYDILPLDDGKLAIVIGDASGHGIAAGILMAIANAALKLAIDIDPHPSKVVGLHNNVLVRTGGTRAFMTVFYAVLDPGSGYLEYCCAGHPYPLLRRTTGEVIEVGTGSLPLGIRRGLEVESASLTLHPGDLLALYSDGIPEAIRPSTGADFGFERLTRLVEGGGLVQQIHDRVLFDLDAFLAGEPYTDDVSLVIVGRDAVLPPVPGRDPAE